MRIPVRIHYGQRYDNAEAEHLGTEADGVELYRVWRQGLLPGHPDRVDVLRLRKHDGEEFEFVGVADPARPETTHLTIASSCLGMPACNEFKRQLDEHGCVLEKQWGDGGAFYLVFTHATGVPIHEWHAAMLRNTIGVRPDGVLDYLLDEARAKKRARERRETLQRIRRAIAAGSRLAVGVLAFALLVGIVGVGIAMFVRTEPAQRPRTAAIAMLVALTPALLTRDGRKLWPLLAVCAAAGGGALALLDQPTPAYGAATALGAVYAVVIGVFGVLVAIFSLFSSNSRQMGLVWFGMVLPTVASAVAAAALAVTSAVAAGSKAGFGSGARTVAIGISALLLLGPAAALLSNVGAVLTGKAWRRNPKLQLQALATLPRTLLPLVIRVGIPIAILWGVVWLLR